jgi:hypothetical protein
VNRSLRDVVTGCKERGWSLTVSDTGAYDRLTITTPTQVYAVVSLGSRHEQKPIKTVRYSKVIEEAEDDFDQRFVNAMIDLYDLVIYEEERIHGNP